MRRALQHSLIWPLWLLACTSPAPDAVSTTSVRDSAGIRIVDNTTASLRSEWRLSAEPQLQIGAVQGGDPAALLDEVMGAVRLSDGRIVIANGGTRELRFFSVTGAHLTTAGGEGGGPGEFRWLRRLGRIPGDTLIAAGYQPGRLFWYDSAGSFLFNTTDSIRGSETPLILRDGSLLDPLYESGSWSGEWEWFAVRRRQAEADGFFRPPFDLVHIPRGEGTRDTLGRFSGLELFTISTEGLADVALPRPFARGTITGFGPDHIYVAHTERFEIQVYDEAAGNLVALIRKSPRQAPISAEERDRFVRETLKEWGAQEPERANVQRWLDAVPWPDSKPALRALVGDADGNLWVAEPAAYGAASETWSVFNPQGTLLCDVEVPAGFEILEIGSDYVLGLQRDELDVEFVRLYNLIKPR